MACSVDAVQVTSVTPGRVSSHMAMKRYNCRSSTTRILLSLNLTTPVCLRHSPHLFLSTLTPLCSVSNIANSKLSL